jgi:hypothetical protein
LRRPMGDVASSDSGVCGWIKHALTAGCWVGAGGHFERQEVASKKKKAEDSDEEYDEFGRKKKKKKKVED